MARSLGDEFDDWFKSLGKKATEDRGKEFKAKFGEVKPKVKDLHIKLGKEDYKALQEAMQYFLDSSNYKQMIRLALKLGMKKWAQDNFDDYKY